MKDRYRLFELMFYPDSSSYDFDEVLRNLKSYKKWAYIYHDNDIYTEEDYKKYKKKNNKEPIWKIGDIKKKHIHFILNLDNACSKSALSKKIGLPLNFIENIRNERSCVRYLIHLNEDDKFQYDFKNIIYSGPYERYLKKCFEELESDDQIINNIFQTASSLVESSHNYADILFKLIQYVNKNCYDTIYKRYRYEVQEFIKMNI